MAQVIIGVDRHKRSATIEIVSDREQFAGQGRFATDRDGYKAMLAAGREYPDWFWLLMDASASAVMSPSAWSSTAKPWSTCRRDCPPEPGCSPPAGAAKPTRSMPAASPWSLCAPTVYGRSSTTPRSG